MQSELAVLVETETRLDRSLAVAHDDAAALRADARARVARAEVALEGELERERARVADEIEHVTAARIRAIAGEALAEIERFAAIDGDRASAIAARLADELAALVLAREPR